MATFHETFNRQLLCTFSVANKFQEAISQIKSFYNVYSDRVFVFINTKNPTEFYLTYNVMDMDKSAIKFPNTILIHRKKQTNTLYTLNAMNRLIEDENGGKLDKSFLIDWTLYQNSLIITGEVSVRIIPLQMYVPSTTNKKHFVA